MKKDKSDALILGIESSCDETAAAVVKGGREVLSCVINSQIDIHKQFGGVVPEIASRNHVMNIIPVIDEALKNAGVTLEDINAVAVTYGAGLVGALLVGVSAAKAISYAKNIPLIKVNHIEGHIAANFPEYKDLEPPFLAVVASGGHTSIIEVLGYNEYKLLGSSVDDAIGEAFDKVARILGLPYPGGPYIDKYAKVSQPLLNFFKKHKGVNEDFSLSYSGLKTAVVNYVHTFTQRGEKVDIGTVCASFTVNAVDMLLDTVFAAAKSMSYDKIVLSGGVAANHYLREQLRARGQSNGYKIYIPSPIFCTDNAVMIASRAYYSFIENLNIAGLNLNAVSNLRIAKSEKS